MSINQTIQDMVIEKISDAQVTVNNMGQGHFSLAVTAQAFVGKNMLAKQVSAICHRVNDDRS